MKGYLEGYRFKVVTDHQALVWLQKLDSPTGRLGRWKFELQQFDFSVAYRKGKLNMVADALSRQPETCAIDRQPCRWYHRKIDAVRERPNQHPEYRVQEGHLYRHILHDLDLKEVPVETQWKRCVSREQRLEILRQYHDAPTAGHLGIAKTITRITQGYWPGMFREIARYVRNCKNCTAHKASQLKPAEQAHPTLVASP